MCIAATDHREQRNSKVNLIWVVVLVGGWVQMISVTVRLSRPCQFPDILVLSTLPLIPKDYKCLEDCTLQSSNFPCALAQYEQKTCKGNADPANDVFYKVQVSNI